MGTLLDYFMSKTFDVAGAKRQGMDRKEILLALLASDHTGKEKAIRAIDLADRYGDRTDRPVRMAIQALRNEGHLILSNAHGDNKGYYMASTLLEYQEFRQQNFRNRALSILHTDRMMAQAARQQFGDAVQLELDLTGEGDGA